MRSPTSKLKSVSANSNGGSAAPTRRLVRTSFGAAFDLLYEPVVALQTGEVHLCDVVLRSASTDLPDGGSIVAAAMAGGVVGELGRAVRSAAARAGPATPLVVRVHPCELGSGWLSRADDPLRASPQRFVLAIAEGVPLAHFEKCRDELREARSRGARLMIDDLGAGYSNLKYIALLEPDFVRIDREITAGLRHDARNFRLVSAMVRLCHSMGALVIAGGVTRVSELAAIADACVDYVSGEVARPHVLATRVRSLRDSLR